MKPVETPVETFILICEKCGKKLSANDGDESPSRDLQKALKSLAKNGPLDGALKSKVRPVVTSCMNICPEGQIAMGVIEFGKKEHFFTIDLPQNENEVLDLWTKMRLN